jgi:hypothetical protein
MRIKELTDTVASLQMHWALVGIKTPHGQPLPNRKGVLMLIVIKTGDGWGIAVGQNTDIVAPPDKKSGVTRTVTSANPIEDPGTRPIGSRI